MRAMTKIAVLCVAGLALSGCAVSRLHIADEYGREVRQSIVAQVAEPDAKYVGLPEPGANGARVGLAQDRYVKGEVIKPASTTTQQAVTGGGS